MGPFHIGKTRRSKKQDRNKGFPKGPRFPQKVKDVNRQRGQRGS